ncbi:MAG: precorrin-6A synthase (deacetylating) [Pseudomonadota bacterium]
MQLTLIGIGTGNPDHVTAEGVRAIRGADLILLPQKGEEKRDLADLRRQIVVHVRGDNAPVAAFDLPTRAADVPYFEAVEAWHDAIAEVWAAAIAAARPNPSHVALLIWGDPSLYDSSLRIAARLSPRPILRVVPGITALQALTAAHAIPLNDVGAPVLITTGRRLRAAGWPAGVDRLAVMLDGGCAFAALDAPNATIWWGAFLGMPEQILHHGRLADVSDQIVADRAAARERHGWIMDTYILARASDPRP